MHNWIGRFAVAAGALAFLVGCGDDYTGPLSHKPMAPARGADGQTVPKFLRDRVLEQAVPARAWDKAAAYFDAHLSIIRNRDWLTIIDFTQHSGRRRFFVINLSDGDVGHLHVAHGQGSDPEHTGYARRFSNEESSHMTSLGFYLVAEPYTGKWGRAARLDGLDSTNSKARERAIVLHGADYVNPNLDKMGRSWGCPAVDLAEIGVLLSRLTGGSLLYAYHEDLMLERGGPSADPLVVPDLSRND
jgi:hypothetical protein